MWMSTLNWSKKKSMTAFIAKPWWAKMLGCQEHKVEETEKTVLEKHWFAVKIDKKRVKSGEVCTKNRQMVAKGRKSYKMGTKKERLEVARKSGAMGQNGWEWHKGTA